MEEHMRYVIALISLLFLHSVMFAAASLTDNLPPELAGRMRPSAVGPPDGFPVFQYPGELAVLGSIDEASVISVVLGEVNPDAQMRLADMLRDAGWQFIPDPVPPRTNGFIGAPRPERPAMYCHDMETGRLSLEQISNQGERYYVLGFMTERAFADATDDQASCRDQIERSQRRAQGRRADTYMPRLELPGLDDPATAPQMRSSSNGGGQDYESASAQITTIFSLSELSEHFARQLNEQGWVTGEEIDIPHLLTSTWTRQLDDGSTLLGVLSIATTGEDRADLHFRLVRRASGN